MNNSYRAQAAAVSIALGVGLGALALPAQATIRCDGPTVGGAARACAAGQQGTEALRRFIFRTRMIYGFSFLDFQPDESAAPPTATVDATGAAQGTDAAPAASTRPPR
jgi:hypothetical protein